MASKIPAAHRENGNWVSGHGSPKTFVFYLVPDFTLLAFSSAIEPLRLANQVVGHDHYNWRLVSSDGYPVTASNGIDIGVGSSLATERAAIRGHTAASMMLICGGVGVKDHSSRSLESWIRECRRSGARVGALCTGTYLLARSGILENRRCTIHWENSPSLAETFNCSSVTSGIFEVDDDIYTCAGGAASFDMILHIIADDLGGQVAAEVCNRALTARMRDKSERQRLPFASPQGVNNPIIKAAVNMMQDNLWNPVTLEALSGHLRISRRQIERLFQIELGCSPARYYLKLRLERAKLLLTQTTMPVIEVAVACGFVSASHFSRCYREVDGKRPHSERTSWPPKSPHWTSYNADALPGLLMDGRSDLTTVRKGSLVQSSN